MDLTSVMDLDETSALPDDEVAAAVGLLVDLYDSGGAAPPLAATVHRLAERTENDALAALVDWWAVTVGRPSTGPCWNQLDALPEEWRAPMQTIRDLADRLPSGVTPRAWLEARRGLHQALIDLDREIGYHSGNFNFAGERAAWADLSAPYERLSETIHDSGIPDEVPEYSESLFRRIAKERDVKAGSVRDRLMKRTYGAMHDQAVRATQLAEIANVLGQQDVVEIAAISPAEGPVAEVATRALRVLLGGESPRVSEVASTLVSAASPLDAAAIERLGYLCWEWHEANAVAVPPLERTWADRRRVLEDVRRLQRTLSDEDLAEVVELVESEPDLSEAQRLIDDLSEQVGAQGRRQSVLDRLDALVQRVEELDRLTVDEVEQEGVDELHHLLGLVKADVDDEQLDAAEQGLEELGPRISAALGEVHRARLVEIADELDRLGATVVSSAGLLSRELKAQLGGLDADDPADRLIEEYEDRLQQVRAEAGRKVAAAFDRVDERTDQIGDGLHGEDRLRLQRLLDEGRAALADGDLIRADASSREAAAFLDERVVPEWRSDQGEPALVEHLVSYLRQSVRFTEVDIRRLHISLKTKPFVILAGLTGTGKSTIGRLYAEALDATTENGRFRRVVVRPNWVDETEVLGYLNPTTNRFEPGWLSALIRTCHRDPDLPVFCVLDEMNLAPVEQYLADVLSAMEEQRTSTAGVPIQLYSPAATPTNAQEWPASILLPDNLFLLGTVNVDETTRPLSDRVLDRANVLQLSSSIDGSHHESLRAEAVREPRWRVRMGEWASIVQAEPFSGHHEFLIEVGEVLTTMRIGLGIRSHLEIERFCANSRDVLGEEAALDHALLQRVIPKVRGFKADLAAGLGELLELLQGVGAESCARVVEDWLDPALGDDAYLDGIAATVGLAAHS